MYVSVSVRSTEYVVRTSNMYVPLPREAARYVWWGMANKHPYTLRYLPCFFISSNSRLSRQCPHNKHTSKYQWPGCLGLDLRMKRFQPLTTHFVSCSIILQRISSRRHGDHDGPRPIVAMSHMVSIIYFVSYRGCTSTYLYIIIQYFPDLNLKSDDSG